MTVLLSTLPPLPERMKRLHVDARGYPVPFFVEWFDEAGELCPRGEGIPDFRVITKRRIATCFVNQLCWICGDRLGVFKSFCIGPMCAVNRTNSEPAQHLDCADFAARACPFLTNPNQRRREKGLPEDSIGAPGCGLKRNPGVALVWTTKKVEPFRAHFGNAGVLFHLGDPEHLRWYCEGRPATRGEVLHSIETGIPALRELAVAESPEAIVEFESCLAVAMKLLPREEEAVA